MTAFEYVRPGDVAGAVAMVSGNPRAAYLAGGTSQLDLMLKDAVVGADRPGTWTGDPPTVSMAT